MGITQLGTLIQEISNKTTENNQYEVLTSSQNGIVSQAEYFNKQVASQDNTGYKIIRKGQFTYRSMSDTGKFYINRLTNKDIGIVSPAYPVFEIVSDGVLPEYLELYFNSDYFQSQIFGKSKGSTRLALKYKKLESLSINLPDLDIQRDAVNKIQKIKEAKFKCEKQIVLLDELLNTRFAEMFGDIIENDKGWLIKPLGELCTIVRGGSPRPIEQFLGGDIPWIKIGDATDGDNIYLNSTKEHIIQEGVKKSRLVKSGSLIFANCGVSLGFARIITFDGCIHDGWLAMEDIDERLNKIFLLYALNQMTEHFRSIAPDGTQPNLNTTIMKEFNQVIPPIELQTEFIRFTEQIDKSKSDVQQLVDRFSELLNKKIDDFFTD